MGAGRLIAVVKGKKATGLLLAFELKNLTIRKADNYRRCSGNGACTEFSNVIHLPEFAAPQFQQKPR